MAVTFSVNGLMTSVSTDGFGLSAARLRLDVCTFPSSFGPCWTTSVGYCSLSSSSIFSGRLRGMTSLVECCRLVVEAHVKLMSFLRSRDRWRGLLPRRERA